LFSWRKTQANDLPRCLQLHTAKNAVQALGQSAAEQAWRQLLEMTHATRSAVVESQHNGHTDIVGFGLGTFVKKHFAQEEVRNPRPGLNVRIIESIAQGKSVVASYAEVRDDNTRADLQQAILETCWDNDALDAKERDEVRVLLGTAYMELFAGYRFSRVLFEVGDALDRWHTEGHRSFRMVDDYSNFHRAHPDVPCDPDWCLKEANPETMRIDPHSIAATLFQHHVPPQLGLTRVEQEFLELALGGEDDESVAKSSFVTVPAIKRRWATIFQRVGAIRPDICPLDGEGTRGTQKRQRILHYLRSHPEELRPFNHAPTTAPR
jgi:hypothetical protein